MSITLSSYTHPGGLAISRRFTFDKVKPKYTEGEIVEILDLTTRVLMMLVRVFFSIMERDEEVKEVRDAEAAV